MNVEQELEQVKQNQIIIERNLKTLSSLISNNEQKLNDLKIEVEKNIIEVSKRVNSLEQKILEISNQLTTLSFNFDILLKNYEDTKNYMDKEVKPEIDLLKEFSGEIIA